MTQEQTNVEVVRRMYASFGQRDLPAVLDCLAEDIDWQSPVRRTESKVISWSKLRHGREEVATFFKELLEKVEPEGLEPSTFTAEGDRVIVEGWNRGSVRSTGSPYEHDWVMAFTLREGRIVRMRHYYDSADIVVAFGGE